MLLLVENAATESYEAPMLRAGQPHLRHREAGCPSRRQVCDRNVGINLVDAPPEQEWVGLMMDELNARG
ncbi:MAG: hypothetical protein AB7I48_22445 [Planctomycetaceae bacterium]